MIIEKFHNSCPLNISNIFEPWEKMTNADLGRFQDDLFLNSIDWKSDLKTDTVFERSV